MHRSVYKIKESIKINNKISNKIEAVREREIITGEMKDQRMTEIGENRRNVVGTGE